MMPTTSDQHAAIGRCHAIDGSLASWGDIRNACPWDTLLLGNGLSINVWPDFAYGSLFERAARAPGASGLADVDRKLFASLGGGTNFERVLAGLEVAIRVARACDQDTAAIEERYRRIQAVLGRAVRRVHIERSAVPERSLAQIRRALLAFDRVFTTCYDLLVYWAMGHGDTFDGFCDCFWANGRNEFDRSLATIWSGVTAVFFLHGALHLVVDDHGRTRKLKRDGRLLLEQFGGPAGGDPATRPLLVTEGTSRDKLAAVEAIDYLAYALDALRSRTGPVVVFGHSLSRQDRHLIDALNVHPGRPVAVSIVPDRRARVRARQGEIRAVLDAHQLYFYDSTSHPLGAKWLRAWQPGRTAWQAGRLGSDRALDAVAVARRP